MKNNKNQECKKIISNVDNLVDNIKCLSGIILKCYSGKTNYEITSIDIINFVKSIDEYACVASENICVIKNKLNNL